MAPSTIWLLIGFLIPLGMMALFTFRAGTFGESAQTWTLENYRDFAGNEAFRRLLWRSFNVAFLVSVASVVLAYPVAYFLAFRAGEARITLLTLLIIPAWTSMLLRVLAFKVILGSNGALNSLLLWMGLIEEATPLFLYNRLAVIMTLVYTWIPFVALPIFAALERIDRSLLEAASDLGAQPWEGFLRITLPLSLPGVLAGFLYVFIPTVGEYVTPTLVGGPGDILVGNLIWEQFIRALDWPMGSLMSIAMLIAILLPVLIFARFVRLKDIAGV